MHIFHAATQWVLDLIRHFGYGGISFGMTLQAIGVPLPSEVMMSFGGYLAYTHELEFIPVVICGTAGDTAGAVREWERVASVTSPFVEEAQFDLAKAYLRLGDEDRALSTLRRLAGGAGDFREPARQLMERIGSSGKASRTRSNSLPSVRNRMVRSPISAS